jgi:Ca-activated chloride channel family protein
VIQPVEAPAGWDMFGTGAHPMVASMMPPSPAPAPGGWAVGGAMSAPMSAPMAAQAAVPPVQAQMPMMRTRSTKRVSVSGTEKATAVESTDLDAAREQAGDEARRLRESAGAAVPERRELLVDLASRLRALVRHLSQRGVPATAYAPLRELADLLDSGGELDPLWARAIQILDEFTGKQPSAERRGPFWKRS